MADLVGKKKRLTINLSLFASNDQTNNTNRSTKSPIKSPKNFQPDGVVGLAILAAINEFDQNNNRFLSTKSSGAAILAVSPRSTPIPIVTVNSCSSGSAKFGRGGPNLGEKMEFCDEEYTCVISHVRNNVIRKFEYFDDNLVNGSENITTKYCLGSEVFSDFLNSCYLCKKKLHGLDIFMYRGEKAFCSAECRCTQISIDEHREKCGSVVMKPFEYSVSPCSGPMQFFTGVAAA